jgi:hypothetical protein
MIIVIIFVTKNVNIHTVLNTRNRHKDSDLQTSSNFLLQCFNTLCTLLPPFRWKKEWKRPESAGKMVYREG